MFIGYCLGLIFFHCAKKPFQLIDYLVDKFNKNKPPKPIVPPKVIIPDGAVFTSEEYRKLKPLMDQFEYNLPVCER